MKTKSNLRQKIILIFSSAVLLIILILVSFFYFAGKNYLTESAAEELNSSSAAFCSELNIELENYSNEISAVYKQIINIENQLPDTNQSKYFVNDLLEKFLLGYSQKYSQLSLNKKQTNNLISFFPMRDFSGKTFIRKFDDTLERYRLLKGYKNLAASNEVVTQLDSIKNELYIINDSESSVHLLFAIVKIDELLNKIIDKIYRSSRISLYCFTPDGTILTSSEKRNITKNIYDITLIPNELLVFSNSETTSTISHGEFIFLIRNINFLNISFIIKFDLSEDLKELNRFSGLSILFSLAVFIILTLGIRLIAIKFIKNLHKLIDVTEKVSSGDLDQKIVIQRNDELGILINSFNEMVDKLKKSYNNLNVVNKNLEVKIEELTQTKTELTEKQRLALVGETVSKISHEIQNKIGGISVWVQNLEYHEQLDNTAKLYLNEIKESLASFMYFLNNFKKFYRKPNLDKTEFSLTELIKNSITSMQELFEDKSITLEQRIESKSFYGDEKLIETVVINLLQNAIYYSEESGIIKVELNKSKSEVTIVVMDTGRGIERDKRDKIFDPFFTTKSSGSGLGLAISKNIIEAHNGKIVFNPNIPKGSCFKIILPNNEKEEL